MRCKAIYSGTLLLAILALSSLLFIIPRPKAETLVTTSCCIYKGVSPHEIVFPYFSLADGFSSTLLLVSDSPKPLNFILAIHNLPGQTELSPSMTIQPDAKLSIDMRSLLARLGVDWTGTFSRGSVSVYFEGTVQPLVGQMTIENPSRRWVLQAEMVENDPGQSNIPRMLNGQWWDLSGGRDATIMVTNASGRMVTADVFLAFQGQAHKLQPLVFNANQTRLLSVAGMLATLNVGVAQAPEGRITIIQRGANPSLVAQGFVADPATGFCSTLEFPDPALQQSSALVATGIPVGTPARDSPYAGDGTFTPHVIASNLLDKPQTVTVTVEYPKAATWNSTNGPGGPAAPLVRFTGLVRKGQKNPNEALNHPPNPDPSSLTGRFTLAPFTIAPDSTTDFSLDSVMSQLPLPLPFASLRIQYSGPVGSMIAQVASVDDDRGRVVDVPTANEGDAFAGSGANPWHLDEKTESVLFLTDEGNEPVRIGFSITAENVHYYLTSLSLSPGETRAINIRQLRDAQVADFKGHRIPAGASDGSVNWIRLDQIPVSGRVQVISRSGDFASSYDCFVCLCPASFTKVTVNPPSFNAPVDTNEQCSCECTFVDCNGNQEFSDETDDATWTSKYPSVAVVDSSAPGQVDIVAGGRISVFATYLGNRYQADCGPPGMPGPLPHQTFQRQW